jgi:hypothetical protein
MPEILKQGRLLDQRFPYVAVFECNYCSCEFKVLPGDEWVKMGGPDDGNAPGAKYDCPWCGRKVLCPTDIAKVEWAPAPTEPGYSDSLRMYQELQAKGRVAPKVEVAQEESREVPAEITTGIAAIRSNEDPFSPNPPVYTHPDDKSRTFASRADLIETLILEGKEWDSIQRMVVSMERTQRSGGGAT